MKRLFTIIILSFLGVIQVLAQEKEYSGSLTASMDVTSRLTWRGLPATDNPTLIPTLKYDLKHWRFGIYGTYDVDQKYKEVDFEVAFKLGDFELSATDFYMPKVSDQISRLFEFNPRTTCHVLDVFLKYSPSKIPVWALVSTMPYGADRLDDKQCFSTYAEIGAYHTFPLEIETNVSVGASLNKGMYAAYKDGGVHIMNLRAEVRRSFSIVGTAIPVSVSYTYNPYLKFGAFSFTLGIALTNDV